MTAEATHDPGGDIAFADDVDIGNTAQFVMPTTVIFRGVRTRDNAGGPEKPWSIAGSGQ